jgi:hypothetical protein
MNIVSRNIRGLNEKGAQVPLRLRKSMREEEIGSKRELFRKSSPTRVGVGLK